MLSLKLILHIIPECPELETLVSPLIVDLLVKLVFLIIKLLKDVLLPFNTSRYFVIESPLLVLEVSPCRI